MAEKWYDKSAVQTATILGTNVGTGLDRDEVRRRRKLDGENDIYPTPKKNYKTYLAHLLTDFNSLLMLTVLLIAAIFEETENLFVMLAVLLTYYTVAMVTYMKSQSVLDDMGKGALPNAKVLREGRVYMVKQRRLVRGDVIYISAGDIVPCDARLVESNDLEVLEVNVTGVTHAVRKSARFEEYHDVAPANQKNMLFASSIVTKGNAKAICCEIGGETLVCKMKKNQPIVSHERLQVFERIAVFCRRWTLAMTTGVFILTVLSLLVESTNNGIFPSFMTGVSLAVSSMSEFYTAFGYIVLACGIFGALNRKKEVNRGALIKNSSKLEDIKNLTCLIVPKEGAFNIRGMSLEKVFANGDVYAKEDRGFKKNAARVLRYALISTGKYGAGMLTRNNMLGENIYTSEEDAIIKAAEGLSEYNIGLERRYPMVEHVDRGTRGSGFDTTLVHYENGFFVSLRGDYSSILPLCRYYTEDSRVYTMTDEKLNNFYIEAEKLARQSYRVIAIASKDTVYNNLRRVANCHTELTLEGLLAIREPILPDAAKNVLRCKNAGIKVIMLSPDESENNAVVAESLGIASSPDQLVTGRALSGMKEGIIRADLDKYAVYQGLTLAQKRMIVRYLQEKGEKVGYLCSELDEIILMKDADVGFAQSVTLSDRSGGSGVDLSRHNIPIYSKDANSGQTGCEALKFVSDVIVSEPDSSGTGGFNAIVDAFLCSKSVYYNLHRMLKYMISTQIARLLLVFISLLCGFTALIPSQILFLGLVTDFAAIIIIAFEKPDYSLVKASSNVGGKLHNPFIKNPEAALMGILWAVVTAVSAVMLTKTSVMPESAVTAYCFVSFIIAQIAMLNECKREQSVFNKNVRVNGAYITMLVVVIAFIAFAFALPSFGELFGIVPISPYAALALLIPAVILTVAYEIFKAITRPKGDKKRTKS
ncbi:MAG: cation-transporting P-type ATPase [Clostridia bacterium]|nr:cation-transporting P-type ATPase [Clostridia bacterium]